MVVCLYVGNEFTIEIYIVDFAEHYHLRSPIKPPPFLLLSSPNQKEEELSEEDTKKETKRGGVYVLFWHVPS